MAQKCFYKRVEKYRLCSSDLDTNISIQERVLGPGTLSSAQPVENFTTIVSPWCMIETLGGGINRGSTTFDKININKDATHVAWLEYDPQLEIVEHGNYFILFNSKRYRILEITNINEKNTVLAIQMTLRGDNSLEASKA